MAPDAFYRPRDYSVQFGRMSQTSIERLRDYLAQLPPRSQALLMREFERAIERGEDATVASFVLEQLRKVVRGTDGEAQPRSNEPARPLFGPLEPFLVEANFPVRPGQVRRASVVPVWQWLIRDGAPDQAREFEAVLERGSKGGTSSDPQIAARSRRCNPQDSLAGGRRRQAAVDGPRRFTRCDRGFAADRPGPSGPRSARYPQQPASQLSADLGGSTDRGGKHRAQRWLPANAAAAAVRAIAGDAAAGRAMANHPPCHQDGRVGR